MATASITPVEKLSLVLSQGQVRQQFDNCLKEKAPAFIASLLDLYASDSYLRQCDPQAVAMEALKAATLDLPINKQLGFAWIVPYKGKPQFQIGYKGYIQLAQRSGLYAVINAAVIYEGLNVQEDWVTGEITITGKPTSRKAQGYLAHFRLLNGFKKTIYMSKADVEHHANRYSASYGYDNSAWKTNFDEMAMKTCLRRLLSKYGPMSTEMQMAFTQSGDFDELDEKFEAEVEENANRETIDADYSVKEEPAKEEPPKEQKPETPPKRRGPSY